jgi:hypothetical protein
METTRRPLHWAAARICGRAWTVRVGLEMPSWRMTMTPGARFFVTSQRMYHAGGCKGSWG